jgi:transposase InsO family protein
MEKARHPVALLCEAVGVSRAGYYEWKQRELSERKKEDVAIVTNMRAIQREHLHRYGSPRMTKELKARGVHVNKKRVERLMRRHGVGAQYPRPFKRTTDSNHREPIAPNLLEQSFDGYQRDQVWVGDITYVWTAEGWIYLAVLLDLYSRRVVGWAAGRTLSRQLAH